MNNPLKQLETFGQSFWLDYIRHDLISSGELQRMIDDDGLRGITSNPAIFEKAIADSHEYDEAIRTMARMGKTSMEIYEALSQQDVRDAADVFRPLYDSSEGADGYVSLEVNPHLAYDTKGTIAEGRRLWNLLERPNVLIKVPATIEGLPAITQLTSEGINVNATLIFGLPRYAQVAKAYIAGIESRLARGKDVTRVASVASFFVSRIDVLLDLLLKNFLAIEGTQKKQAKNVSGQVAIASAKLAYQMYKKIFTTERFRKLSENNAHVQRLLWASTGTKNPNDSDIKYIEALIGPETVNTIPIETLTAYRDYGKPEARLEQDIQQSETVLNLLPKLGIQLDTITQELEDEGVAKFKKPFDKLMESIRNKSQVDFSFELLT